MADRVWLVQCLCPRRHAIAAVAGEHPDKATAMRKLEPWLCAQVESLLSSRAINPWCGLCHAHAGTWRYETALTRFATMAEAQPALERSQREQILTSILAGKSVDN